MRKKANNSKLFPTLLMAVLVFVGCAQKEQPAPPPQPIPAAKPSLPIQKQSSSVKISGVAEQPLDFTRKKDPFKPFAVVEPIPQPKEKKAIITRSGDLLPIQSYDVNKFKVSGILIGFKENTALVIDPAGKGYVVREGMLIGNNDGRISKITSSAIIVVEPSRDDHGRLRKQTIMLTLPKK
jgi:type IV pilus assembly protein PilP